jgi:thymidylate synthase (FAD)
MFLPLSSMTDWYWTGSLIFWARVCEQRLDSHAQKETRDIAQQIKDICYGLFPVSWGALMDQTTANQ